MGDPITGQDKNKPLQLPDVNVYADKNKTSIQDELFEHYNEPKNPWEVAKRELWGPKGYKKRATLMDLLRVMSVDIPQLFTKVLPTMIGKSLVNPGLPYDEYIALKEREMDETADWMGDWFDSEITKDRLADMGHSQEKVDKIVKRAKNLKKEYLSDEKPVKDKEGFMKYLVNNPDALSSTGSWLTNLMEDNKVSAAYNTKDDYAYASPYSMGKPTNYSYPKQEYQASGVHEMTHGIMGEILTDKEKELIADSPYTYEELHTWYNNPTGAWQPYLLKQMPYHLQGAWKEQPPDASFQHIQPDYYRDDPSEVYSRIMAVRKYLDAIPGEYITVKKLEKIKDAPELNDLLRYFPIKEVAKMMNTLAEVPELSKETEAQNARLS